MIFNPFLFDMVTGTGPSGHPWEMSIKSRLLLVPPQPNQVIRHLRITPTRHPTSLRGPSQFAMHSAPWFFETCCQLLLQFQRLCCSTINQTYCVLSKCFLPMHFISLFHMPVNIFFVTSSRLDRSIWLVLVCQWQNVRGCQVPSNWVDFSWSTEAWLLCAQLLTMNATFSGHAAVFWFIK